MTPVWPNGDPRLVARQIVRDPRFTGVTQTHAPGKTLLERLLQWIGDRFNDIFHAIGHVLGPANPFGNILTILGIVAVVLACVAVAIFFIRLPGRNHERKLAAVASIDGRITSRQWFARALADARAERWHDASSALVNAALLSLDETGRLEFDPSRTAGEARRIVRDAAFDAFEREASTALFADGQATPDRFARMRETYAQAFGDGA